MKNYVNTFYNILIPISLNIVYHKTTETCSII